MLVALILILLRNKLYKWGEGYWISESEPLFICNNFAFFTVEKGKLIWYLQHVSVRNGKDSYFMGANYPRG